MPTPWDSADDSDSISPSYTRISVSRPWTTTASTCSPGRVSATTRSPMATSSSGDNRCPFQRSDAGAAVGTDEAPSELASDGTRREDGGFEPASPADRREAHGSGGGAADGEGLHPQGRHAVAHGHALAVL